MTHIELVLCERRAIEDMLNAKVPVSKIAAEIGRHRSSIYREIKRNGFKDEELPELNGYYGIIAHRVASKRRSRRRKLVRLEDLRAHVVTQLKIGWTPEQIAGRLGYDGQMNVASLVERKTRFAVLFRNNDRSSTHFINKLMDVMEPLPQKRARRYLPRDTQLAALSNHNMKAICDRLNGTPRKCLGWRTPTEAFREELMKLR